MQTKLAISSKSPTGGTGMNGNGQSPSGENRHSTIPPQSAAQPSYPSYPRSSAMTFIPVSPGAQSDILNKGSSSGGGGGGSDWGGSGGGGAWGTSSGGSGSEWGGRGGGGVDDWGASSGTSGDWSWGAPAPSYSPAMQPPVSPPPVSYPRPSSMTFTPVTSSPASDILNKGSHASRNEWGGQPSASPWGPQETSSPMVGPPETSSQWGSPRGGTPTPQARTQDPYSSYEFSRPSSMTFTPVTMQSQSDVLNNGASSNGNDSWGGEDWGFTGSRPSSPSPSPPPQPYTPSTPSGVTFKSITPNSSSDILNRGTGSPEQNRNSQGGRGAQSTSSSYTSYPDKKGKGTFSYMPKPGGSPKDGRSGYDSGPSSQFGKPSASSFTNSPGGNQSKFSSKGNSKNDSIWNKMASAVEALAGGSKPSSYSSLNNDLSKDAGISNGNRSIP